MGPVGGACGLDTEPKEGEQPDVSEAPKISDDSDDLDESDESYEPTTSASVQETSVPTVSGTQHSADATASETFTSSPTATPSETSSGSASHGSPQGHVPMIFGAAAIGMAYAF